MWTVHYGVLLLCVLYATELYIFHLQKGRINCNCVCAIKRQNYDPCQYGTPSQNISLGMRVPYSRKCRSGTVSSGPPTLRHSRSSCPLSGSLFSYPNNNLFTNPSPDDNHHNSFIFWNKPTLWQSTTNFHEDEHCKTTKNIVTFILTHQTEEKGRISFLFTEGHQRQLDIK